MTFNYINTFSFIATAFAEENIPFTFNSCFDGWIIRFPWCNGDIAMHSETSGNSKDYIVETFRFPWDEDDNASVLYAIQAVNRIIMMYRERG